MESKNSMFLSNNQNHTGSSQCGIAVMNQTDSHEDAGSIPGPAQWVKDLALP